MATYVLIHGGGHGGWCWQRLVPLLRAEGHAVYTPTLTGLGERAHLLNPGIDLDTHISDIVAVLRYEDLSDVVLVGHSYGGMVITGVADRVPERIGRLVYLDAAFPRKGQSLVDIAGPMMAGVRSRGRVVDGIELVLWPNPAILRFYGVTDPADVAWMIDRLTPHPWACFDQKLRLADEQRVRRIPRTMIDCAAALWSSTDEARARPPDGDPPFEINAGHDVMVTEPKAVAAILLSLAEGPAGGKTAPP